MSSIFEYTDYVDPEYDFLEKHINTMYRGMWTPAKYEKLIKEQDAPYYFNSMGLVDKEAIKRCILAVATVEDKVKVFWSSLYFDIPQTLVGDLVGLFSQSEATHRRSYFSLLQNLKINTKEVNEHEALQGRIAYLSKHLENDPKVIGKKRILKKIILFTSLVERVSLFTQFYILMSFARANRGLETISSLQQTTAQEEMVHYTSGVEITNKIKSQHPQLWDDYLIDLVEKNIKDAYTAEVRLVDWFFEQGVPEHLTKEEVLNFLNYNLNCVARDLQLGISFEYDCDLYESKNKWFMEKILTTGEPDFFACPVGGYSSEEENINVDEFEF